MTIDQLKPLTGAEHDTLWCLFLHGPTQDGDVPSKSGRDSLFEKKFIDRADGWQWIVGAGVQLAIALGMDRKKEQAQRR